MLGFPTSTDLPKPMARRRRGSPVYARNGMVAAAQPLATAAGLEVLANGGNAVDAAIAAALVDAVTMPASCGVGGDLFAIVSKPAKGGGYSELTSVISSGISPRGASLEFMQEHGELNGRVLAQTGPLSPSVPGFPAGIDALLEQFGSKPLTELSKAAIGYAADGFPITQKLSAMIAGERAFLEKTPASAAVFLPGGKAAGPGEMLKQPDLAATIDQIARESSKAFYQGSLAKRMTDWLGANGGALTADDFSDHAAWVGAPLQSTYRGKTVYQTGLPTQGFVQLEAQNILDGFDMGSIGTDSALGVHLMVESLKRAFHDRHLYAADSELRRRPDGQAPLAGVGRRAPRDHRSGPGPAGHQIDLSLPGRHHLSLRHRRRRPHDLAHHLGLRHLGQRRGRGRYRRAAQQPRRSLLLARSGTSRTSTLPARRPCTPSTAI